MAVFIPIRLHEAVDRPQDGLESIDLVMRRTMNTVSIDQAKADLARLVERAAQGESFIIAEAGKPMVKVVPLDTIDATPLKRVGFMVGQMTVPDDFDEMGRDEIEAMFSGRT
jgi:prevent-host-death family protein